MSKKNDSTQTIDFLNLFTNFTNQNYTNLETLMQGKWQDLTFSMNSLLDVYKDFYMGIIKNPDEIIKEQMRYLQEYMALFNGIQNEIGDTQAAPLNSDKRIEHQRTSLLNILYKNHELMKKHLKQMITKIADGDIKLQTKLAFYTQQVLDAISPENFIATNPKLQEDVLKTGGENFLSGFKNFVQDIQKGNGFLDISSADLTAFEIGKNIAITPGKVIYQNDLMQLIHYTPTTSKTFQIPLLIIPPWINKYYILDLQPHNSLVKWLVDQGHTVFIISWVNPDNSLKHKEFADYMLEGPLEALKAIQTYQKVSQVNVLGYCVGGTLLGCTLAYLAAMQKEQPIKSATYLTTLLDFSEPGNMGVFLNDWQIKMLEDRMAQTGYLDGYLMYSAFSLLRAPDMIWNNIANNYLKGKPPAAFDILYWNADSTNIPEKVHSFYLRNMYLHNRLIIPNAITLNNIPLDIHKITVPNYCLAAKEDHIAPWTACYNSMQCLTGQNRFVLTDSGHVGGIINPPSKNKHGYRLNADLVSDTNQWLEKSTYYSGSWWPDYQIWLAEQSGKKISVKKIEFSKLSAAEKAITLEEAPGSYVKKRLHKDSLLKL